MEAPTSKCALVPRLDFKHVVAPWYISCTNLMYTYGIYRFRMHLYSTSRGTVSYAFSRSTNTISRGILIALPVFLTQVLMTDIASVVPTPDLKPNCSSEMVTMSLSHWSMICSQSFIVWLSSLIPLYLLQFMWSPLSL